MLIITDKNSDDCSRSDEYFVFVCLSGYTCGKVAVTGNIVQTDIVISTIACSQSHVTYCMLVYAISHFAETQ